MSDDDRQKTNKILSARHNIINVTECEYHLNNLDDGEIVHIIFLSTN